jgi:hypothetical protein
LWVAGDGVARQRNHWREQLKKTVSWSTRERLRCLWYRLRLTVAEMNYATRRAVEVQARCWRAAGECTFERGELVHEGHHAGGVRLKGSRRLDDRWGERLDARYRVQHLHDVVDPLLQRIRRSASSG